MATAGGGVWPHLPLVIGVSMIFAGMAAAVLRKGAFRVLVGIGVIAVGGMTAMASMQGGGGQVLFAVAALVIIQLALLLVGSVFLAAGENGGRKEKNVNRHE